MLSTVVFPCDQDPTAEHCSIPARDKTNLLIRGRTPEDSYLDEMPVFLIMKNTHKGYCCDWNTVFGMAENRCVPY